MAVDGPGERAAICVLLVTIALGSCGKDERDRRAQDVVASVPPAPLAGPKDTVASAGRLDWNLASVEEVLRKAGLNPVRKGTIRQPFLPGAGVLYEVGRAELQVYIYADAGAVARDTDPLDTSRVAPPTMQISWRMPPALIVDNNLVAILLTRDESLRRRVKVAIESAAD